MTGPKSLRVTTAGTHVDYEPDAIILATGLPVFAYRFYAGLGWATNLSQTAPWGLWIGFDVVCGVGLAAGWLVAGGQQEPAEPLAAVSGLAVPLAQLIAQTARSIVRELGLEREDAVVQQLGPRWQRGRLVLHSADPTLQAKEVPLEVFFPDMRSSL